MTLNLLCRQCWGVTLWKVLNYCN